MTYNLQYAADTAQLALLSAAGRNQQCQKVLDALYFEQFFPLNK